MNETKDDDDRYRAPALDKGLDILELLSEKPHGLTRGEIVKAMGRGPSEIYRMLETLVQRHYVTRSAEGDRYALSLKLFVLANRHPPLDRLVARALPVMDAFTSSTNPACSATIAMINSAAFPKVAFSSPPSVGPVRAERCSVASPM